MTAVKNQFNEFESGRTLGFVKPRPETAEMATKEDNVSKAHELY